MITKSLINIILHHVGMSWIICYNKEMEYEIDKTNDQDWLNKGPWYSRTICLRLYGSMFEDFITNARTNRYKHLCYLVDHDTKKPAYEYEEISI